MTQDAAIVTSSNRPVPVTRRSRSSAAAGRADENPHPAGTETILVVEDDEAVRGLVCRMLNPLGYRVLEARDGREAMAIVHSFEDPIHLVLCDIILPDRAGPEIVKYVQVRSSDTRAVFMSGHTNHLLIRDGVLGNTVNFIQKPFTMKVLASIVREALDA